MKYFFLFLLVSCASKLPVNPGRSIASVEGKPLSDDVILMDTDCGLTIIDMVKGSFVQSPSDKGITLCKNNGIRSSCSFMDSKGKIYSTNEGTSISMDQEAIIALDPNQASTYVLNLVTRKYFFTANIFYEHGRVRGNKNCVGDFMYGSEVKKK